MTRYSYKDFEIIFYAGYAVLCFELQYFRFLPETRRVPEHTDINIKHQDRYFMALCSPVLGRVIL
jgi:hypothetical protein